ncbi:PIG-L deacetylase family protein [Arsenicicoccus sp. oral taxon 190]|uniref:PIG-L deacetylase family protein n=1 Tax=Arsenicicoccus sp. oral taxon 190 TaxID=1658671 RepID=UPI0009E5BC44
MSHTLLAFHAHPDDEALLTSGTLARAAAEGHRVIVVTATDGDLGLTSSAYAGSATQSLGERRLGELMRSCRALGVARVEWLGYADSGSGAELYPDPEGMTRFVRADVDEAAERLARILREESVDVLLTYDRHGGYGHRDHVQVHRVGARAAELAGTPRVLQATVPRDLICRALDLVSLVYRFPPDFDRASFDHHFSAASEITHRVDVRRHIAAKRASMRAHASQAATDDGDRTLAAFLRIPRPLYDLVFQREWFVDASRPPGSPMARDVFDGLG